MHVVLFDLMDTLVADPIHRVIERLQKQGHTVEEFLACRVKSAFEAFERGEISENEYFKNYYKEDLPESIRESLLPPRKIKKEILRFVHFLPEMEQVLKKLHFRDDVKVGIASNYGPWYQDILKLRPEIENCADFLFFSCEIGGRKPQKKFYEVIHSVLREEIPRLSAGQILFFDDRKQNLAPAEELGWRTHLAKGAAGVKTALEEFGLSPL